MTAPSSLNGLASTGDAAEGWTAFNPQKPPASDLHGQGAQTVLTSKLTYIIMCNCHWLCCMTYNTNFSIEWALRQPLQTLVQHLPVTAFRIGVLPSSLPHLEIDIKQVPNPPHLFLQVATKEWVQVYCFLLYFIVIDVSVWKLKSCIRFQEN